MIEPDVETVIADLQAEIAKLRETARNGFIRIESIWSRYEIYIAAAVALAAGFFLGRHV
jgi:hypothetical protein